MRALQVVSLDGPDGLTVAETPEPEPAAATVLIDVHAAGVSFVDLLLARGEYQIRPEPPFTPGIEVSGIARDAPVGSGIQRGDRVAAMTPLGGGFAESALAPVELTFEAPAALSFAEAAGLTQNYLTAMLALRRRGRLKSGETVLVHGAAGGVGTAAIQIARASGARVLAAVSTKQKASVAREAGADEVLDTSDDWVTHTRNLTQDRGVDVVVDPVGGDRVEQSLRCLAPEGRVLVVGFTSGHIGRLAMNRVLLRHADIVGVNLGGLLALDPAYLRTAAAEVAHLVEAGLVRPVVRRRFALEDGAQALRELAGRSALGKLVIEPR